MSERSRGESDYNEMATYGINPRAGNLVDPSDPGRTNRMADLEVQALEARSRRQFDKLEEKVEKRQYLEARLLEAERMFREEKMARKEADENFEETTRRLNDATNSRLKVEEQANMLARTEEEVRKMDAIVSKLKDRVPVLTTELEKTLAVAHEQSLELSSFDAESNQQSRVIQRERLEAQNAMEEELRELGLQVARLTEHVEDSGKVTARDSEVLKGLIYDETKMLLSAQGDVENRKQDMKAIDARLSRILKTLELTQEAHYHLKANMNNTSTLLKEAKENDEREYKFMHHRLTMPYMREELKYDEKARRTDPLPHQRPNRAVAPERFANHKPLPKFEMEEDDEEEAEARRAEADAQIDGSLDFAFNFVQKPVDPLDQPPLPPAPPGPLADILHARPTEGEELVSQSIQLLKEMQLKQASTNTNIDKQAKVYNMSLDRLDKEIKMHQKHLDEIDEEDFSEWNKQISASPDKPRNQKPRSARGGAGKSHVAGKSVMDLFAHYDQDNSGTINKGELICLLSDIGVLDGLKPEETSAVLDQAYANADGNGDGGISYNEFRSFMDKFSHLKPKPSLPQNIPDSFRKNGKDEIVWQIYLQHCSKKYPQEMGSAQFIRAMRKAGFVDVKINPSTTAILFAKARKPMAKRMQYPEFLRALAYMATARELTFEVAAAQFANRAILRPITNVTVPKSTMNVTAPMETAPMPLAAARDVPAAVEEEPAAEVAPKPAAEEPAAEAEPQSAGDAADDALENDEAVAAGDEPEPEPDAGDDGLEDSDGEGNDAAPSHTTSGVHLSEKAQDTKSALMEKATAKHDMKSWELKDAIDAVGQMPVPKSMIEASGNKMLIREFFYQCCSNGKKELMPDEVATLLTSLEVFKGLEDEEVSDIVEDYVRKMDTNGDGVVSFDEFAIFYMDIKETRKGGAPKAKAKVNSKYKSNKALKQLFIQHSSYGKGKVTLEEMDGAAFAKLVSSAGLLDSKLTNITVDLVFTKSKLKGKRKLTYNNFLDALSQVASHKGFEFDKVVNIVMDAGPPKRSEMPAGKMHLRKTTYPGMPTDTGPKRVGRLSAEGAPKLGQARVKKVSGGAAIKPIPMQSKVGKNLTIREMFDMYDPDQSGVLDRVEFGKLVVELQLTRHLHSTSEQSAEIDKHYLACDIKGEGNVDYREFSNWYKALTGERSPSQALDNAPKVPLEYRKNADFKALYVKHCSFGKGNRKVDALDSAAFVKCLRQAGLLKNKLNVTSADLIFTKCKEKGQRTIKWVAFLEALAQCAAVLGSTFEEVADTVIESGEPQR